MKYVRVDASWKKKGRKKTFCPEGLPNSKSQTFKVSPEIESSESFFKKSQSPVIPVFKTSHLSWAVKSWIVSWISVLKVSLIPGDSITET